MNTKVSVNVGRSEAVLRLALPAERKYQELWLGLARSRWSSLVVVPADPAGSCASIARSLAEVGSRLSDAPVTAVTVDALEYASALAIRELQRRTLAQDGTAPDRRPVVHVTATPVGDDDRPHRPALPRAYGGEQIVAAPESGRLVIAIPSVLAVPLGLAVVADATAVVLSIERGRTRLADVRRTVELVGRERVAGCFLVE